MFTLAFLSISGQLQRLDALEIVVKELGVIMVIMGICILFHNKKINQRKRRRKIK